MWGLLAAGVASGLASGAMSMYSAHQQQQSTVDAYKHRHQWQVADLRAAGLNPVLSATQGAGSVGSMAQGQAPDLAGSANSAASAALAREQATTAKTTQVQQLTQADVNESTAAHQSASAREASARADIAESVADQYKHNPALVERRALTEAGYNANTPIGAVSSAVSSLGSKAANSYYGNYINGGSITASPRRNSRTSEISGNKWSARY